MKMKVVLLISLVILLGIIGFMFSIKNIKTEYSGGWERIDDGTNLSHTIPLVPIKSFDKNNGIAIRIFTIQRTDDGGRNWSEVYYEEGNGVYGGVFTNENEGWVVGTKNLKEPLVLKTDDKGISWKEVNFDEKSLEMLKDKFTLFRDICFDTQGQTWISGDGGLIKIDTTQQELKLVSLFPVKEGLFRISCSDSGETWATGVKNSVFRFEDAWNKIELNENYWISNVKTFGTSTWLIGSDNLDDGILLFSRNGGQTWENKTPELAKTLNDLYLRDGEGWLVGVNGSIYYSSNNGDTWTKTKSPTESDLLHIFFLDSNNGWISGDKGIILKYQN